MGILQRFFQQSQPQPAATVADLDELKSQMRILRLEWAETLDKVLHALDRINKRSQKLANENQRESSPETIESLWETVHKRGLI